MKKKENIGERREMRKLTEGQKQKLATAFQKFEEQKAIEKVAKNIQKFYEKQQAKKPGEEQKL